MLRHISQEKNIVSAAALHSLIKRLGLTYGCLPISICALNGVISFDSVIRNPEKATSISSLTDSGLETGFFAQIDKKVTAQEVADIFEALSSVRDESGCQTNLTGFLFLSYFFDERQSGNHFFAILPTEKMPRALQKSLVKRQQFIVVDSKGRKLVGKTRIDDLAEYCNQIVVLGGQCMIFQVFKM